VGTTVTPTCNNSCICCDETVEEMNTRADNELRRRALTTANVTAGMFLGAHIYFSYLGKTLPIPDIVWALVLAPWMGAATGKVLGMCKK
jgi:hypothetical protein